MNEEIDKEGDWMEAYEPVITAEGSAPLSNDLLCGIFESDEREELLFEFSRQYHNECEEYDESICTGRQGVDGILPANNFEFVMINKNAIKVRERILSDAEKHGFSRQEVISAIKNYRGNNT